MDFSGFSIAAGSVVVITLILVGIVSLFGQGATVRDRILSSPTLSPLLVIHYFLPYALIILVIFMDIMSQLPQGSWSLLVAFVLMIANIGIGKYAGGNPQFPSDLCEIPGMKGLASSFMPQTLLFVSTIVFYLAGFVTSSSNAVSNNLNVTYNTTTPSSLIQAGSALTVSPSSSSRIGATWGLAVSVVLLQLLTILSTPECLTDPLPNLPSWLQIPSVRAVITVILGGTVGGVVGYSAGKWSWTQPSYGVNTTANTNLPFVPGLLPTSTSATQATKPGFIRERFQLGTGLGEMPMPPAQGEAPIDIAKSSGAVTPGESSDQFVCEAYKNGQLVTSTLVG